MIRIEKQEGSLSGTIDLTPSKSITNRMLVIRALTKEDFTIHNKATANDSVILERALQGGQLIDVGDAGTACRFLTAYLCIQPGHFRLTGTARMRERPIAPLVNALRSLGARIEYLEKDGFLPLDIYGDHMDGGEVTVDASLSSQFVSALMMIAPVTRKGMTIFLEGEIASLPYIEMTAQLMRHCGAEVIIKNKEIRIEGRPYVPRQFIVENDWSSASFWYTMLAMAQSGELVLKGLNEKSVQGDSVIHEIMLKFGVESVFDGSDVIIRKRTISTYPDFNYDFGSCPDLVLPLAVLCAGLNIRGTFKGVRNLRLKESDRLSALHDELAKMGRDVIMDDDSLTIQRGSELRFDSIINSHNDHRIAMSFATLCMLGPISIDDGEVVKKSYPEFWSQLNGTWRKSYREKTS